MDRFFPRAFKVAGAYALVGILWVVFSDRVLAYLAGDAAQLTLVQTIKGIAYILATSAMLLWMVRRVLMEQHRLSVKANESEKRFKATFEQAAVGIAQVAFDGTWLRVNSKLCDMLGYSRDELNGKSFREMTHPEDVPTSDSNVRRLMEEDALSVGFEKRYVRKDGGTLWVLVTASVSHGADGTPEHFISVFEDIGPRKKAEQERNLLEAQLLQSQKMEAIGRLAGGVAHDFNNMLSVISGYTESAMLRCGAGDPIADDLKQVQLAAERSAALTRQLLAFARKEKVKPRTLNLNDVIDESLPLVKRLVGIDIALEIQPGDRLWPIHADANQLDQVLINLAINSRDAIAGQGRVEIRTDNTHLDRATCAALGAPAEGDYIQLTFSDTGCGMTPEVIARAFEPFFTTKEAGKGTGLGLATVFGIVQQNGGAIKLESSPGAGATFRMYFPRHEGAPEVKAAPRAIQSSGLGTVLLVEDEGPILNLLRRALEREGYRVLAFGCPMEAAEALPRFGALDVLVTDVLMPGMNGAMLADRVMAAHPNLKVIFMSGHTGDVTVALGSHMQGSVYLEKPFVPAALLDVLSRLLKPALAVSRAT